MSEDAKGPSLPSPTEDKCYADDLSTTTATTDDSILDFNSNGVIIPYFAFVSLLNKNSFQNYLKTVKEKFEETEGPLSKLFEQEDLNMEDENNLEEEDNNNEDVVRSIKKTFFQNGNPKTLATEPS